MLNTGFVIDPKKPTHPPTLMCIYISQNKCKLCKQLLQSTLRSTMYNICLPWLNLNTHTVLSTILNPWIDCNVTADGAIWWIGATLETAMEKQWYPLQATLLSHAFQTFSIKWENGQVKYFGIKGFDV